MVEKQQPIPTSLAKPHRTLTDDEAYYAASQWKLMWRRFRKHQLGMIGMVVIAFLYTLALFSFFFQSHPIGERSEAI
jgi:peptide/nickel transport system permease protein